MKCPWCGEEVTTAEYSRHLEVCPIFGVEGRVDSTRLEQLEEAKREEEKRRVKTTLRKRVLSELLDIITYDKEKKLDQILDEVLEGHHHKDWRFAYVSKEVMDKLGRFQVDIDGEVFRKLFMQVGGSATMAEHLWTKFRDVYNQNILPLWLSLDPANRELVLAVINRWTG